MGVFPFCTYLIIRYRAIGVNCVLKTIVVCFLPDLYLWFLFKCISKKNLVYYVQVPWWCTLLILIMQYYCYIFSYWITPSSSYLHLCFFIQNAMYTENGNSLKRKKPLGTHNKNYLWRQMVKSFSILTYQISLGFVALELGIDLKSKQYLGFRQ